jgi:hypothetical protein
LQFKAKNFINSAVEAGIANWVRSWLVLSLSVALAGITAVAQQPVENRWGVPIGTWHRYDDERTEQPYQRETQLWHPYLQSVLKGDVPVIGQDIFLNLTLFNLTDFEGRRLPKPSGISTEDPNSAEFFGRSDELFVQSYFGLRLDLFKGETAFKPVEWQLRLQPVFNLNYTRVEERNVLDPDPRRDIDRFRNFLALQEAFLELHIADLSESYDFIASRFGNQTFTSDFRGFIFNDTNLGARLFGNYDNNHWQYNLAVFAMREKDTFSELNRFDDRDQYVVVANVYRQDFLTKGYTAQLSFHANFDNASTEYDRNGFLVRPAPLGTVEPHDVRAYYLGWTGDGHIGRLNITHAFYEVFGEDELNGLAGRRVNINAQMAALELSYDIDWLRPKLSILYASGDDNAEDGEATGFDTILDNPFFLGAPFSFYAKQGFNLGGTSVNLKQRNSLVPNLRTSKTQGQSNFVNPGVFIVGAGLEIEVTPKLRTTVNANYIRFVETNPIETALFDAPVREEFGYDLSIGCFYRPLLTDNIIIAAGFGAFLPGDGFRDIYRAATTPVPGFPQRVTGVEDFYYSGLVSVTLTY